MTVLILLAVVALAYVAYINRDRIKAALNKDDGMDAEPDVAQKAPIVANPATLDSGMANVPDSGTITATLPIYNGAGDPPNQEAWTAWLATLDPMTRSHYPAIWKPTPVQSGAVENVPVFKPFNGNMITDSVLKRGERALATGTLGVVMSFPIEAMATRVTISETSGTGDRVHYNLWVSDEPNGMGESERDFQYNNATLILAPSNQIRWANVRALVEGGRTFYIQAN